MIKFIIKCRWEVTYNHIYLYVGDHKFGGIVRDQAAREWKSQDWVEDREAGDGWGPSGLNDELRHEDYKRSCHVLGAKAAAFFREVSKDIQLDIPDIGTLTWAHGGPKSRPYANRLKIPNQIPPPVYPKPKGRGQNFNGGSDF